MKRVEFKTKGNKTVTVETKWLRIEEAAAYLGVVRSTFDEVRQGIPNGLVSGAVVYDCQVLDRFANQELPEEVYSTAKKVDQTRKRRKYVGRCGSTEGLRNPVTGKVFRPGQEQKSAG